MRSFTDGLAAALQNRAPVSLSTSGPGTILQTLGLRAQDTTKQMEAQGVNATLFAITDHLATDVGAIEWQLFRKYGNGRRDEIEAHPALVIWNQPNPYMGQTEFVEIIQQHADLTGEWTIAAARANGDRGIPLELWPLRPDRMAPVAQGREFLLGWEYRGPDGIEKLPVERVIHTKSHQNPLNPWRGMSPVATLLREVYGDDAAAEYNAAFFRNGAEPGGLIKLNTELSDDQIAKLRRHWYQNHQGAARAHSVGILTHGEWIDRKISQKDMEFTDLRKLSKETIRTAFSFPKFVLGEVDDVNRNTADVSATVYAQYQLVPRARRLREMLNSQFLPMFPGTERLEFDFVDPTPQDAEGERKDTQHKIDAALKLIHHLGVDPSEALEYLGLPDWTLSAPETVTSDLKLTGGTQNDE